MEARTITDEAKRDLIHVLNESLEIEYDMILNYPRMIEKLENIDKIHDEQLNYDLQLLGRQSIRHFNEVDS